MNIAVDGRMVSNTGIGRWLQNVVRHLAGTASKHNITVIVNEDSQSVRDFGVSTKELRLKAPIYSLREQVYLPFEVRAVEADVVHCPNFNVPLLSKVPLVLTLCDLIYYLSREACPSWIGYRYARTMIPIAAGKARRIITISEYSKRDLTKHLGCPDSKIEVVYPGVDRSMFSLGERHGIDKVRAKLGICKPYLFYTGNHERRKNLAVLVEAYRQFRRRNEYQLVLGGRIDARQADFYSRINDLVADGNIILCGEILEADLPFVYAGSDLFVFPSMYEGFGLPPLEAMAAGVPVVCSNATSLPEAVGDAAITFSPDDVQGLVTSIERVLGSSTLADELIEKGKAQVRKFSWHSAAQQIMDIYELAAVAG